MYFADVLVSNGPSALRCSMGLAGALALTAASHGLSPPMLSDHSRSVGRPLLSHRHCSQALQPMIVSLSHPEPLVKHVTPFPETLSYLVGSSRSLSSSSHSSACILQPVFPKGIKTHTLDFTSPSQPSSSSKEDRASVWPCDFLARLRRLETAWGGRPPLPGVASILTPLRPICWAPCWGSVAMLWT